MLMAVAGAHPATAIGSPVHVGTLSVVDAVADASSAADVQVVCDPIPEFEADWFVVDGLSMGTTTSRTATFSMIATDVSSGAIVGQSTQSTSWTSTPASDRSSSVTQLSLVIPMTAVPAVVSFTLKTELLDDLTVKSRDEVTTYAIAACGPDCSHYLLEPGTVEERIAKVVECETGIDIRTPARVNGGAYFTNVDPTKECHGDITIEHGSSNTKIDFETGANAQASGEALAGLISFDAGGGFSVSGSYSGSWTGVEGYAWNYSCHQILRVQAHGQDGYFRYVTSALTHGSQPEVDQEDCEYRGDPTDNNCWTTMPSESNPKRAGTNGSGYENVRDSNGDQSRAPSSITFHLEPGWGTMMHNDPATLLFGAPVSSVGLDVWTPIDIDWTVHDPQGQICALHPGLGVACL